MSPATDVTFTPVASLISAAVRSSTSRVRATIVTSTPSRARANAQALPRPLLAPLSSAFLPRIPRSTVARSWRCVLRSGGDRRKRPDLVAVLLVEPELLDDAYALGE